MMMQGADGSLLAPQKPPWKVFVQQLLGSHLDQLCRAAPEAGHPQVAAGSDGIVADIPPCRHSAKWPGVV